MNDNGAVLSINMPDADSEVELIVLYRGIPSDEEYQEQSNNLDSTSLLTADGNTLSVGGLVYAKQNEQIAQIIESIHHESPDKGYRRILDELEGYHEIKVNDKRVLRICRKKNIRST